MVKLPRTEGLGMAHLEQLCIIGHRESQGPVRARPLWRLGKLPPRSPWAIGLASTWQGKTLVWPCTSSHVKHTPGHREKSGARLLQHLTEMRQEYAMPIKGTSHGTQSNCRSVSFAAYLGWSSFLARKRGLSERAAVAA